MNAYNPSRFRIQHFITLRHTLTLSKTIILKLLQREDLSQKVKEHQNATSWIFLVNYSALQTLYNVCIIQSGHANRLARE